MTKNTRKPITKEELEFIVDNWETMHRVDIANNLDRSMTKLNSMVHTLRSLGVNLPKKSFVSVDRVVFREFAEEWTKQHKENAKKTRG